MPARVTFDTKRDAVAWLDSGAVAEQRADPTLAEYAEAWLARRALKPSTAKEYRALLRDWILPTLGDVRLSRLDHVRVSASHRGLDGSKPTRRKHAYVLLTTILRTAADEHEGLPERPCRIRGAATGHALHEAAHVTPGDVARLVAALPEPGPYRTMTLVAAWCGLRLGELTELRRSDDDDDGERMRLRITRAVVRVDGEWIVGTPKSRAGRRTVAVPSHVRTVLLRWLAEHVEPGPDALLFTAARRGGYVAESSVRQVLHRARERAGLPTLRFHDLRHAAATFAAEGGASPAEMLRRFGHTSAAVSLRYQHASDARDAALADRLAALAEA